MHSAAGSTKKSSKANSRVKLLWLFTCRRAAIFLATSGVGVANVHLSFRVALAMSALAMAITIWEKLDGGRGDGTTIRFKKSSRLVRSRVKGINTTTECSVPHWMHVRGLFMIEQIFLSKNLRACSNCAVADEDPRVEISLNLLLTNLLIASFCSKISILS